MTRILITGGEGQVGFELRRAAWPAGFEIVSPRRAELDLTDVRAVKRFVGAGEFDAVVNAAAYTAVDKAEEDVATAFAVNALAPAALAEAVRETGAPLVQISTDYVFNGRATTPYEVNDSLDPLGIYGASKLAGEFAARLGTQRSAIVRTAWVVSARRANFVRTMLRVGQEREVVRVVADQYGAPTLASDLASALATITQGMIADPQAPNGVFHFASAGATSWHGFAAAIFAAASARGLKTPRLEAIATVDYPTAARRPAYSVLSTSRVAEEYGVRPLRWDEWLPGLVAEIAEDGV